MERYPALKLALVFLTGILGASALGVPFAFIMALGTVLVLSAAVALGMKHRAADALLYLAVLTAGAAAYQARHFGSSAEWKDGSARRLALEIIAEPRQTEKGWRFPARTAADFDGKEWLPSGIKLMAYAGPEGAALNYGDRLVASGTWVRASKQRNPGGFDYQGYLEHQEVSGIFRLSEFRTLEIRGGNPLISFLVIPLRGYFRNTIERYLDGDQASLLSGLLLGERHRLSSAVREAFSDTGTTHVLAVSGLHAGLMALIIFILLRILRLPKRAASLGTVAGLVVYTLVAGAGPSIVRSSIMAGMILLGGLWERRGNGLNMLGLAGLLILSVWPDAAFDLGFQLSFSATAGILILTRPLEAALFRLPVPGWCRKWLGTPLAVSLAAQIFTAPFLAWHFHRVPLISLAANLLVVPLTGLVLALGLALVTLHQLGGWLAWPLAASAWLASRAMLDLVSFFSSLKVGTVVWPEVTVPHMIIYLGLLALPFLWRRSGKPRLAVIALVMLAANLMVWQKALAVPPVLKATFLDVGQGDCSLVEFPNGKKYLIDTGLYTPGRNSGQDVILPVLRAKGITELDAVLISHSDADHCGGLKYLLERVRIGRIIISGHPSDQRIYNDALESAVRLGVAIDTVRGYDTLAGAWPARGFLYSREDSTSNGNESSLVLYLRYGRTDILFPGDMGPELESILRERGLLGRCKVLKVPHHGARSNNPAGLTETVRPELAVISVGGNNRFGHPSPEALENYRACGSRILRTDQCGAAIVETDGDGVKYSSMLE
jgi:competence protein ComEC